MKNSIQSIAMIFILLVARLAGVNAEEALTPEEAQSIAEEAYIFSYPMIQNYKTFYFRIVEGKGPVNSFLHRHKLLGPEFTAIVAPNHDTLYSSAWLDLRTGPLAVSVPEFPEDRYYSLQFIDMYVYNFAYIGRRATGSKAGSYLIVGPNQTPPEVPGISGVFQSEGDFVFVIGRILAKDEADQGPAVALQGQIKVEPLSRFLNQAPPSPAAAVDFPVYDPEKAKTEHFVEYFNFLLQFVKIHPDDASAFERFRRIGISPGAKGVLEHMAPDIVEAIRVGADLGNEKIQSKTMTIGSQISGWNTAFKGFGSREIVNGQHLLHAAGAMFGLYGHNPEENSTLSRHVDADRLPLDGSKYKYTLRFEKGQLPPAKAFWSLTLYQAPEMRLYENSIKRYNIGDRTPGLKYGADGSLTLYIQHESPGKDLESNWLPARDGIFALALRMYLPDESVRNGTWLPPEVYRK